MRDGKGVLESPYFDSSVLLDLLYEKIVESSFAEKMLLSDKLHVRFDEEYDTHGNRVAVMRYEEIALLPQARGRKRWIIARGVPKSGSLAMGHVGDLLVVQYKPLKKEGLVTFLKQESLSERLWFFRQTALVAHDSGHLEVPKSSIYSKSALLVNACFHERAFTSSDVQPVGRTQECRYSQASVVRLHAVIEQLLA